MDFSTYLPILLALGLIIIPELNKNNCTPEYCCQSSSSGCSNRPALPECTGTGCYSSVNSCYQMPIDICGIRFKNSPEELCCCRLQELQDLADNGYETWRRDPVAVSARFMQGCFIDPCFRGKPSYLAGQCRSCDKTYVVLGVGCVGKMIFELCQPVKNGENGIWIVTRYAKYDK